MNGAVDEVEEGECSDDGTEDVIGQYTPLTRPVETKPASTNKVDYDSDSDPPQHPEDSDSDSDAEKPSAKRKYTPSPWGRRDAIVPAGSNDVFKEMAAAFQAKRNATTQQQTKRQNNIWGTILQEDSLNSDLLGVGVGRSLRDLKSDRGAEAYDYTLVAAERAKERMRAAAEEKEKAGSKQKGSLDREMEEYWAEGGGENMEEEEEEVEERERKPAEEEKRGTKRSAKERLGGRRVKFDRYKQERLPSPGKPKQLIDIGDVDVVEGSDKDFGELLAARLGEDKPELIEGVVRIFGRGMAHKIYQLTQKIEGEGGMVIQNGARRRTSGGIYLFLMKTDPSLGLDQEQVRNFLADARRQDERKILAAKKKQQRKKHFDQELQDFLALKRDLAASGKDKQGDKTKAGDDGGGGGGDVVDMEQQKAEGEEEEEELVELDVSPFSNIAASMATQSSNKLSGFQEPDAPPNSVERVEERTLQDYEDDDFLNVAGDTESIELF